MSETGKKPPQSAPSILTEAAYTENWPAHLARPDGLIVTIEDSRGAPGPAGLSVADTIWRTGAHGTPPPEGARICVVDGLARAAAFAAADPGLFVVPRAEVVRASRQYGFDPAQDNSGFKTYHLNPATVTSHVIHENGARLSLAHWLEKGNDLGFSEFWLHGADAEKAGSGFPCDLLKHAHRLAPEARFWISGGGRSAAHVETIAPLPGLVALIVADDVLADLAATAEKDGDTTVDGAQDAQAVTGV